MRFLTTKITSEYRQLVVDTTMLNGSKWPPDWNGLMDWPIFLPFFSIYTDNFNYKAPQKIIPSHGALQHIMELWNTLNPAILKDMILYEFFSMK